MKFTNRIIEKFGADKLLHLTIAGWLVSLASLIDLGFMIFVSVAVIVLSFAKEYIFDDKADIHDIVAAMIGLAISWISLIICYLLA